MEKEQKRMTDRNTTKRMFTRMVNMMEKHDTMTISCGDPLMKLLKDVRELLKEQNGLMLALEQSNAVNGFLNAEVERLNGLLKEQEARIEQLNRFVNGFSRDAMPVVHCKDCKYCEYPDAEKEWCKKGHLHGNAKTWFCADGERREVDA